MKASFALSRSVIRGGALALGVVAAVATVYGFERYTALRDTLRQSAAEAAVAAARNPTSLERSARLALAPEVGAASTMEIETGLIDGAGAFQPSAVELEAVRIRLSAGFDLFGLSGLGLTPPAVASEATVRRFPIAALAVSTEERLVHSPTKSHDLVDERMLQALDSGAASYGPDDSVGWTSALAAGEAGRIAMAAVFGVPPEIVTAAAAVEATFTWADLAERLSPDSRMPKAVPVGELLAAAAAAIDKGQLRDRAALETLAAAVPDDLPKVVPEAILAIKGLPGERSSATEFDSFGLPGSELVASIGRFLAADHPVRFSLDRPADGVARIDVELGTPPEARATIPSRAVGSAGAAVGLPALHLVARATIYGLTLPGRSQVEIPVEVTVAGGVATIQDIECDLAAPANREASLVLDPVRADVVVKAPLETEEGSAPPSPSEDFVMLFAADDYTVWLRGRAAMPATRPVDVLVSSADLGTVKSARVPADLTTLMRRAVVEGDIHVSSTVPDLPAAAIRDEIHRGLRFAGPGLADTLTAVLSGFGVVPGALSASVQKISCNGVELLP